MSAQLTSIVLRDEAGKSMGHVAYRASSGWLWACAHCPAANAPSAGIASPVEAVAALVEHIESRHP